MRPDERGTAPPAEQLAMSLHRERGRMVADDLRSLPTSPLIVAEGSPVSPAVADPTRAVWLIPTPEFRRARRQVPLYELLAAQIEREVSEHAVPTLTVHGSRGIDETVAAVEALFAEPLAVGPRAETPAKRRALLREANEAIIEQVRGYYARPWADGDAESIVREFICECGDTGCDATVDAPVGMASASPVVAAGHASHDHG
jgi:hypothetical protein